MQVPKELLGDVKDLILNSLLILKDEDYQKNIWFRTKGPEVGSYGDTTIYFLNSCEYIFKNPKCVLFLGKDNYDLLKKLYDLVLQHLHLTENRFEDTDLIQENDLLNDPKWHDIQSLANEVDRKLTEFVKRKEHEAKNKR